MAKPQKQKPEEMPVYGETVGMSFGRRTDPVLIAQIKQEAKQFDITVAKYCRACVRVGRKHILKNPLLLLQRDEEE